MKNKTLLIISVALLIIAAWLMFKNKSSTVREELRDFAVKDTAAVTKIFLADRSGKTIELEREAGKWRLNKKFYARKDAIHTLLETMYGVSVRSMIAKASYNTVIKQLSTSGIKCEVYLNGNNEPHKIFYVGSETQDSKGTYMMLENSSVPFVTEILGFDGYLTPRFFTNELEWRDKTVFAFNPADISAVSVMYYPDSARSFKIDFLSEMDFSVSSPMSGEKIIRPDTTVVVNYLSVFAKLNFEFFDFIMQPAQRDSILSEQPVRMVTITDKKGKQTKAKFYNIPVNPFTIAITDTTGEPSKYDIDRMYAFINNDSELVGVQMFVFGKIFRTLADFDFDRKQQLRKFR